MISDSPTPGPEIRTDDEGGLRPPPGLGPWRRAWWWFDFIILVKLARLRFIAVLVVIGAVITQWDTLANYYEKWTRKGAGQTAAAGDSEWFCPMHPAVVRDNSKDKCPICFMPLSKRKKGESQDAALPPGVVNRVQLSPYRVVLAGVQTRTVDFEPLTKEITAVGSVEFNERGLRNISSRIKGRIDQLFVSETGQMVDAGDELASLYCPELIVTAEALLESRRRGSADMATSSRARMELLGISEYQINDIIRTGKPAAHVRIHTPISGHVIKRYVREGQYVEEGSPLYDVADLSTVWIQAQIYEDDIVFLPSDQAHKKNTGMDELAVTATTRAFPNEPFHGKLAFIYPHVDQETRTVTVRFQLDNPGHKLRPGATAVVRLQVQPKMLDLFVVPHGDEATKDTPEWREKLDEGLLLAVPESSVIETGTQTIVYRETMPGTFEGVAVQLGPRMSGPGGTSFLPVLHGLAAGDRITTSGSFLVDAETRLNPAAGSIYFGGSGGGSKSGGGVTSVRPSTPEDADAKIRAALAKLPAPERSLAEAQKFCPVLTDSRLGSMGVPAKLNIAGQTVFVCCNACKAGAQKDPQETLAKLRHPKNVSPRVKPATKDPKIAEALAKLSEGDRKLAEAQRFCAVMPESPLGSMGVPAKVMVAGRLVFLCCQGCEDEAKANAKATLSVVERLKRGETIAPPNEPSPGPSPDASVPSTDPKIEAALAKLSPADRKLAESQRYCAILTESPLGSMGKPIKLVISGQPVFICCQGCEKPALAKSQETLKKVEMLKKAATEK